MADETNNNTQQQQPSTDQKPQQDASKPLNEQLIKSAVSFLSSPNVQSAETVKKVAFLQKKGLSAEEIQEAFKRVDQTAPSVPAATTASPPPAVAPPAPLIPKRTAYHQQQPSIIYQPLPPTPPMPLQRLIAIALIFGVGAVGVTSGIIGIVKRLLLPTFNGVTSYQMGRYKQQKSVLDKLGGQLAGESTDGEEDKEVQEENNNNINASDEKKDKEGKEEPKQEEPNKQEQEKIRVDLSKELAEKQAALADRLAHMVSRAKARHIESKDNADIYTDFGSLVVELRNTINKPEYMQTPSLYNSMTGMGLGGSNESSTAVHGLKSEIRSLKGILLNRRRIN